MHKPKCLTNCLAEAPEQTHARGVEMLFTDSRWMNLKKTRQTHLETTERQWEKFQYILVNDCVTTILRGNFCSWNTYFNFLKFYYMWEDWCYFIFVPLTRMTFSMSFDGHQWNIPVESYLFTFMSMLSICSFPGIRRGSCRLWRQNSSLVGHL